MRQAPSARHAPFPLLQFLASLEDFLQDHVGCF
jgi:hypothetical protein